MTPDMTGLILSTMEKLFEYFAQLFETSGLMKRFARFKAGEALETLLAEAEAAQPIINPKTRRETPAKAKKAE